jgi:predicted nucleotide-binding protein
VDLAELYVIDDGVEEFFVHRSSFLPKDQKKRVLLVRGSDLRLNARITKFLNTTEATLCETESDSLAGNPVQEQIVNNGPFEMAVVALAADCWIRSRTDGQDTAISSPSPLSCFQLGYLVSRLGRGRVIVVYEESNKFHRPTGYFDVIYVPMDPTGVWRREISTRLQDNNIAVRDLLRPLYRG